MAQDDVAALVERLEKKIIGINGDYLSDTTIATTLYAAEARVITSALKAQAAEIAYLQSNEAMELLRSHALHWLKRAEAAEAKLRVSDTLLREAVEVINGLLDGGLSVVDAHEMKRVAAARAFLNTMEEQDG
jgi:hypothetical protein